MERWNVAEVLEIPEPSGTPDFLAGGGEMGERIRAFDWASTPLGPSSSWSPALRTMVRILLANGFPQLLWWGPHFIQLYNDPYRPVPGTKHPHRALGRPARECWSEIWHIIGPLIQRPFNGGPPTWDDDILLEICRHGFVEESHFTIAYSPVPDETMPNGIGGVLATVHEITEKVVGERRVVALRDLGAAAGEAKSAEEACRTAARILETHSRDVPFALFYLLEPGGKQAHLAGAAGVCPGEAFSPQSCDLALPCAGAWPLGEALARGGMQVVENLAARFATVPPGPWSDPPHTAVVMPIPSNNPRAPVGVMVAGVSARLKLDRFYRDFLELVKTQIATAVANARAYQEERQRAETAEALRQSVRRYEQQVRLFEGVASTTPDFVYVFDPQGRFLYANHRLLQVWGMKLPEVVGKTCRELGYEQWHHDMHMREIAQVIDTKRPVKGEVPFKAPRTGVFGVYEYIFTPVIGPEGDVELIAGTTRDVTERKQAEEALARSKEELEWLVAQRTAKLKEMVAELEHFSYTITHDMRAPLRAMRGFAEVLQELQPEHLGPTQQDYLHRIITGAARMDALIIDALNYSKAVRQELPLAPVDVRQLLQGMLESYPGLQPAQADIHIDGEIPQVLGNEAGLTQCLSNLLGNAVKFVEPGKKATVRVRAQVLEDWVRLWVEDQGPGIPPAMLPRVFDMFARGSNSQAGTGIGLALVRKVVDRMGGRVGVESEPGKGSRFWVELQAAPAGSGAPR